MQPVVLEQIAAWNDCGTIQKIEGQNTPWLSPIVTAPKRVAPGAPPKTRVCLDLRQVNQRTESCSTPIPNMRICIDSIVHGLLFSQFDMVQAFTQIKIRKEDRFKTAFVVLHQMIVYINFVVYRLVYQLVQVHSQNA